MKQNCLNSLETPNLLKGKSSDTPPSLTGNNNDGTVTGKIKKGIPNMKNVSKTTKFNPYKENVEFDVAHNEGHTKKNPGRSILGPKSPPIELDTLPKINMANLENTTETASGGIGIIKLLEDPLFMEGNLDPSNLYTNNFQDQLLSTNKRKGMFSHRRGETKNDNNLISKHYSPLKNERKENFKTIEEKRSPFKNNTNFYPSGGAGNRQKLTFYNVNIEDELNSNYEDKHSIP
jgi:hypothetical protein